MSASLSSPPKIAARCSHFGACGGCALQDRGYEEQLRLKEERVSGLLAPLQVPQARLHRAPDIWFYRNKMEFSFGDVYPPLPDASNLKLGLKPRGKWYEILDLKECFLLSEDAGAMLAAVRRWAEKEGLAPHNSRKHQGFLRHLIVREAKNTTDRLVGLVTAEGTFSPHSLIEALGPYRASTVVWGVNRKKGDTARADCMTVLHGPGTITELIRFPGRELKFRISPYSFFQTNTKGAEVLYGILRDWAREAHVGKIIDLYCGGGGIALSVADLCGEVAGLELNAQSVADARDNAAANNVVNTRFFTGQAEVLLPAMLAVSPDVVIVDPPRVGLHPRVLSGLLEAAPSLLFYVSCNPEALARDIGRLLPAYRVERVEIIDLFPHTEHVETAVRLRRKALT